MAYKHTSLDIPSLNQLLSLRAEQMADKTIFSFIDKSLQPIRELTYKELHQSALRIAAHLKSRTKPGDRAVLLFPPSLDYIEAYFGCLYAGVIAVPVFPPQMGRQINRVMQIVQDSRPRVFMSTAGVFEQVKMIAPQWVQLAGDNWLSTDRLEDQFLSEPHQAKASDVAFLQYTSGSTGTPKGVIISHENLLHNEKMIKEGFGTDDQTVGVNWLPLYHDMGLIGTVIHPIYLGGKSILMSPFTFLTGPANWLKAISEFKGSCCGGPNFAYEMCLNKVSEEDVAQLDLSSWKQAFNGAEPIRASTLERFEKKFDAAGFNPQAWRSCYGLAEATLMVSTATPASPKRILHVDSLSLQENKAITQPAPSETTTSLVSSGMPVEPQELRIVDVESMSVLDELQVGEIWIAGPHVARGYWKKDEINPQVFAAQLKGEEGNFFRTGDLGFLKDGELYITGREKDLIIIRGKNHYPQDIEQTVMEAHEALQAGGTVAFGVEGREGESLVVISELTRNGLKKYDGEEIAAAIRQQITETHELQVESLILIPRKKLLKTSSGKVQRRANKEAFLKDKVTAAFRWDNERREETAPVTEEQSPEAIDLKSWLMQWMMSKLKLEESQIDLDDPITAYGVDSLMLAEFETEVSEYLGTSWPVRDLLLTEPSLEELIQKGEEFIAEKRAS